MNQTNDFHLPDEILNVIPTDPYDQLDLARKITSLAIASRVSKLESESGKLKQKISEKDRTIEEMQAKISQLESLFQDSDSRLKITLEENAKLSKERDSLAMTAKKLARDLAKLETFKRHLVQSLSEENSSSETVDIRTYDQTVPKPRIWKERGSFSHTSSNLGAADTVKKLQGLLGRKSHHILALGSPQLIHLK